MCLTGSLYTDPLWMDITSLRARASFDADRVRVAVNFERIDFDRFRQYETAFCAEGFSCVAFDSSESGVMARFVRTLSDQAE